MKDPHYLIQFFAYSHLKPELQKISKPFGDIAMELDEHIKDNPEKSAMLRKLLEAKDCAIRAYLFK